MNHYDVLRIRQDATDDEIKAAYRKMMRKFHPDTAEGALDPSQITRIQEAYNVLKSVSSRASYDALITPQPAMANATAGQTEFNTSSYDAPSAGTSSPYDYLLREENNYPSNSTSQQWGSSKPWTYATTPPSHYENYVPRPRVKEFVAKEQTVPHGLFFRVASALRYPAAVMTVALYAFPFIVALLVDGFEMNAFLAAFAIFIGGAVAQGILLSRRIKGLTSSGVNYGVWFALMSFITLLWVAIAPFMAIFAAAQILTGAVSVEGFRRKSLINFHG